MEDADSEDDNNDYSSSEMNTSRADETETSENGQRTIAVKQRTMTSYDPQSVV